MMSKKPTNQPNEQMRLQTQKQIMTFQSWALRITLFSTFFTSLLLAREGFCLFYLTLNWLLNTPKQMPTKQRGATMHLEAWWGAQHHHIVWSWEHPTQSAPWQRPSVSSWEAGAPQGGPFPQHQAGMSGCTKMVLKWSPHVCSCGATAAPLMAQGLTSSSDMRPSALLVLASAMSRGRSLQTCSQQREQGKREKRQIKLPSLLHLPWNPPRKV